MVRRLRARAFRLVPLCLALGSALLLGASVLAPTAVAAETGEASGRDGTATAITGVRLDSLKTEALIDEEAGTVVLPVEPGTELRKLRPEFDIAERSTIRPGNGSTQDFTTPVEYEVRSRSHESRTWTVRAVEMNSPSLPGHNADPNIVRFGDTYYIYATTDGFPGWSSDSFKTWSSTNLVDWTEHDTILDLGADVSWADGRAWAPAAIEKNGKYYFYFTADTKIGVAVADSPTGPFVDSGEPLVAANPHGGQAIDPAVFTDEDGQSYLYWGNGHAYVVPLNDDMVSFDWSAVKHLTGLDGFREGLFMHERAGTYYLSWSIGDTRSEDYRVGYATGTSPMMANMRNRGEILTKRPSLGIYGTGHHSTVRDPETGEWFIAYHRHAVPDGDGTHREVTIDRLRYAADGTIRPVEPTLSGIDPV
ncbi:MULTISPECIES: family 43 glycosylhydrolase [unclassified Actinopolyspora]|uniref:family 43 glycosylhydrolase n=1 Tax=unclassified Actinopolyspora TaxID=2639451 RepID=UPI0013F6623D|nr:MULTISPECIES: family 43 glycosylhydrolase [unclassified Actinopolyspora]NHD19395.1 family 43 glycosylhydrolase [Actinopolyspora sp. BKK2]NHE78532.1 family 43 glycosylhydrolase [Actinopolyspora sp. BKK1]